jgi:hypothetical protein
MKVVKISLMIAIAIVISLGLGSTSYAFHSGGVAECEGCHTMHNTITSGLSGTAVAPIKNGVGNGAVYLLKGNDQSSTCLNCHDAADTAPSSYHISTDDSKLGAGIAPVEATPGGDFAWLKKTYNFSIRNTPTTDDGAGHGHNINAADYGYTATNNTDAPGGTYPQASLHCSSCHNPHGSTRRDASGNYSNTGLPIFASGSYNNAANNPIAGVSAVGAYRLLGGAGYLPKSLAASPSLAFGATTNPPDAVSPSTYNRLEYTGGASAQTHVAYGRGMSEWCGNCHSAMLENSFASGVSGHRHPAGNSAKMTNVFANYNSYVTSGNMTNVTAAKAYNTLAPFELGTGDYTVLKPLAVNTDTLDQSASANTNVMCLSCHRAHASGFPDMTRFFLENEFMTIADASNVAIYDSSTTEGKINYGKTQAEQQAAYYGRPATAFGPYARDLCNKCHAKD